MSRNNVFKLSGNMALGSNDAYSNSDFENIKSSLKLLKSKQTQRRNDAPLQTANYYGGSYSSNAPSRQQPTGKNFPSSDYPSAYNYAQNQPSASRAPQQASQKDAYYQMEQKYPVNEYKPKRSAAQDYEQPQRNAYHKQTSKAQQQQPVQRQQQQPVQRQEPRGQGSAFEEKSIKEVNRENRVEMRQGSAFEEKSIKEVNRENRVEMREYDPSQLVECSEGCGRKFNPDSIAKHENVCRKVFQKKRKEFNAQEQRLIANEQKKLMKKGEMVEKKLEEKKAREKIPKWKAESLALRSGIKASRDDDYVPTKEEKQILEAAKNSHLTKCQFCGRSFNEQAAQKHIPFCESQQKKNQMRKK